MKFSTILNLVLCHTISSLRRRFRRDNMA